MTSRKDLMNEAFNALLVSTTVVGLSMGTIKLFGEKLVDQSSIKDIAKMAVSITGATMCWLSMHKIRNGFLSNLSKVVEA